MSRYGACQPYLFPPLYLVERMARVEKWIVLEDAQFDRHCVRQVLRNKDGKPLRMAPSVSESFQREFRDVRMLEPDRYFDKLTKTLHHEFGKCPGYAQLKPGWDGLVAQLSRRSYVVDVCWHTTAWVKDILGIQAKMSISTAVIHPRPSNPTEWIGDLGVAINCNEYVQGAAGYSAYLKKEILAAKGIKSYCQDYTAREGWDARTSILGILMEHGVDAVREEIRAKAGITDTSTIREVRDYVVHQREDADLRTARG